MAQNRGAGKKDRVKEGFRCGIRIELVYAAGLTVVCFFGAEGIMRMFAEEPEVIELGARFLRLISLMYFLPALTNGIQGFFRGHRRSEDHPAQQYAEHGSPCALRRAAGAVFPHGDRGPALELRLWLVPHAGLRSASHAPLFAQRHDGRKRIKSQGLLLCQAEKKPLLCYFVHFLQNKSYSFVGFRKIVYFSLTMSIDNLFAPVLQ